MSGHLLGWTLAAVLLFWAVGAYNRMVRLRSEALRAFAALGLQLQRFPEHVLGARPASATPGVGTTAVQAADAANLVDATAVSTAVDTRSARPAPETPPLPPWAGVIGASTQFTASLAVAKTRPLDGESMAALGAANAVLRMAWQRAAADDGANAAPGISTAALVQWDELNRDAERLAQDFAAAVNAYNAAVTQFPAALLAWLFGFRKARPLAVAAP